MQDVTKPPVANLGTSRRMISGHSQSCFLVGLSPIKPEYHWRAAAIDIKTGRYSIKVEERLHGETGGWKDFWG